MIVDPVQALATVSLPLPTASVAPVPGFKPVQFQDATETGVRTLW